MHDEKATKPTTFAASRILREAWADVRSGKNLDTYAAVTLALTVAVFGVFGISKPEHLTSITLVVLSYVVLQSLAQRKQLEGIESLCERTDADINRNLDFHTSPDERMRKLIDDAREIHLIGSSNYRIVEVYKEQLEDFFARGGVMKIIFVKPTREILEHMAKRSSSSKPALEQGRKIENAIREIQRLHDHGGCGALDIRVVSLAMAYSAVRIEPADPSQLSYTQIRISSFRHPKPPIIRPDPLKHQKWIRYFQEEFDRYWQIGEPPVSSSK